ncbi:MAG: hypothetical protein KBS95_01055 [Alistipes sp.]|nr:hypothetical protein [Candidatus Alistipes equi]
MKTTFKFIIAAMAAISVFSSCQKEPAKEKVNDTIDGVRTIAVQFDNSTKATLDGLTPKFANGDAIRVSNTEKSEECTISVDGSGNATFSTTLSGDLTAIYPADAAVFTGNGPISDPFFKVLAIQDGDVAKAIIAKAEIDDGSTSATFTSQTALFQITPPAGATTFTITSLRQIGTDGQRSSTAVAINTEGADDAAKRIITVTVPAGGTAYVSIVPDVKLSDLSFEYITDVTNGLGAMKGIPAKDIAAAGKTDATAANTKYTIDNGNWHPYVTIDGKKWATMNIGATSAIEVGKYFMWGEITGLTSNDISSASFPSSKYYSADNSSWVQTKGFAWENCPWTCGKYVSRGGKKVFTKYIPKIKESTYWGGTGSPDDKTTLDLADDSANAYWGGSWRMPTNEEFVKLALLQRGEFVTGSYFGNSDTQQIFLPAAGYGDSPALYAVNDYGRYWSSSAANSDPSKALGLRFSYDGDYTNPYADTDSYYRYIGQPVRAISD